MRVSRLVFVTLLAVPYANSGAQQRASAARSMPVIIRRDSSAVRSTPVITRRDSSAARPDAPLTPMARAVPGSVTTLSLEVPRPLRQETRTATYVMRPAEGVRLFGDTTGQLAGTGDLSLPITFSVLPDRDAGNADVATVNVTWSDGSSWTGTARVSVVARHALRVTLRTDGDVVIKGQLLVRALITNSGNATDSVRLSCDVGAGWLAACDAGLLVLPVGGVAQRTIRLSWPTATPSGETRLLRLVATGRGGAAEASLLVRASASSSDDDRTIVAATSVFVGSDSRGGTAASQSMALASTMQLASDSWLTLGLRRQGGDGSIGTRVFAREMNGGRTQINYVRPGLGFRVGDVFRPMNGLLGSVAAGQGLDLDLALSGVRVGAIASQPHGGAAGGATDQARQLEASVDTRAGSIGAQVAELRSVPTANGTDVTAQEFGVHFVGDSRIDQRFSVDVGVVRLKETGAPRADQGSTTGAAIDMAYDGTIGTDRGTVSARYRQLPAVLPSGSMIPNLASLSLTLPFSTDVAFTAAASQTTRRTLADSSESTTAVSSGLAVTALGASTHLVASAIGNRRTLGASVWMPFRSVIIDAFAQTGLGATSDSLAGQQLQAGARWTGTNGWLWAGVNYAHIASAVQHQSPHLEATGAITFNTAEIEFGATGGSSYWSRLLVPMRNGFQLVTGVEYSKLAAAPERWRLLAGMKRSLDVPLPLRRPPVMSGVVFEDVDGDGRRNSTEPLLAGIVLRYGQDQRTTTASGEFAFADKGQHGDRLDVDAASLPEGFILPPTTRLAQSGRVDVALVRTGTLVVVLRTRRSDGGFMEEIQSAQGAIVSVRAADGRTRDEAAGTGVTTFEGLVPGDYLVTISVSGDLTSDVISAPAVPVTIKPGERKRLDMVPPGGREVRFAPK